MKYILSEEEYNTLQSRIQSLESVNKELRRDLEGTKRAVLDKATKQVLNLTQRLTDVSGELRYYKAEYMRLLDVVSSKEREILRLSRKAAINEFGEVVR